MKVSGGTHIYGIMGYPIEHSLSPVMHNAGFEALGLESVYIPFLVKPEDLGKATMALRALNVMGVNVTLPHKSAVIEFLDELDTKAKQVGAVGETEAVQDRRAQQGVRRSRAWRSQRHLHATRAAGVSEAVNIRRCRHRDDRARTRIETGATRN